ncbi:C69 family dipeptidase [Streptococcus intermedius]|uniref:C69 family dipeptidase n=1 Tax=Streptococcus intermedius TaxID=1338 RepID=UPI00025B74BC|nr:C69 family dipeptidase [Streptococcus intermedius]EID82355.1 peptidase, C69 family / LPXTG cell wall anchor domain multi-domain protein [Streptococcus intermedius SK54 = ATCC 27335]EPH05199.1 D-alanyl-D-alanine dipeptidase [Streptococcus intermedius SK54 = ATCC 27335]BAM23239.1 dipeptidase homolog [Streptococcus intermedius JTH08]SQH51670.1 putative dipeptidase [Streptococcus intermedius]
MKKFIFRLTILLSALFLFPFQVVEACTGFIVGKNLTADGSTLYGRTEDLEPHHNKVYKVHPAKDNKAGAKLIDEANGFEWQLPARSYKYTSVSDVTPKEGIFDEVGFNEHGVSISATVSAKANKAIQKVDPYVKKGLAESIMTTVVLPHVKTAREGVELIAEIVKKQGAAEGNIVTIADKTGVWYMEILSGHQYVAIKYPDDKYSVFPNTFFLGSVDFNDKKNVIASENVEKVARDAHSYKEINGKFHISQSYNPPMSEADRSRAWAGIKALNPDAPINYDDKYFDLLQSSNKKISVADVMRMQRNRFEGTQFKPLDQMELDGKGIPQRGKVDPVYKYPLGNPNVMEAHIFQLKDNIPASMGGGTMWLSVGSPRFAPYLPYYGNITNTYSAYQVDTTKYDKNSWYWVASHIYDMAAKHQKLFGNSVQEKWKALEAQWIEEQAKADEQYAAAGGASPEEVTTASMARAEKVFKEMKALEAEMEEKIKNEQTPPSSSSGPSSSSPDSEKPKPSETSDTLMDTATGVRLQNADLVKAKLKLAVKKTIEENADSYDITLTNPKGKVVSQVSSTVVTVPVKKGATVESVYAMKDGKQEEKFDFVLNNDQTISFKTTHFSIYKIHYKVVKEAPKQNKHGFLPSTGEKVTFLGLVGVVILGIVIFILAKRSKKNK